jgi:lipopolysaccharide biosynthesis glycosyltransferase
MKKIIVTLQVGDRYKKVFGMLTPYIENYARKCGAAFNIINTTVPEFKPLSFFLNKFQMFDYLKKYDKVLLLDSDILVTT